MADTPKGTLVENQVSSDFYQAIKAAGIQVEKVQDIAAYLEPVLKISIAHPDGPLAVLDLCRLNRMAYVNIWVQCLKPAFEVWENLFRKDDKI